MAKLKEYNGRYCEADFENAFLSFLEAEGWQYLFGNSIPRASRRDVLYVDDLEQFLRKANPDLLSEEIRQIIDNVQARPGPAGDADQAAEEKILLAEYALDFAVQAADRALLTAMEAIEAEMTQNERTKEGNPG